MTIVIGLILYIALMVIIESPEGYQDKDGFHYGKRPNIYKKKNKY